MPKLVFTNPKFAGHSYQLVREKTTVGRADDNLLVIRDPSVSSRHCEILVNGEEVIVRDLGSRNGTFVNGARLQNQQNQVKSGGTVRFGTVDARLEIEYSDARDEATEITAIYSHGRAMRDQRRARENAPPADPGMQVEPSMTAPTDEQTILVPHAPAPAAKPGGTEMAVKAAPAATPPRNRWWLVAVLAAAGLAALVWLVWLIWFRK